MNQCLKISIARGGCRFATPLYLGSSYVLSFDGTRSDEAKKVILTKPRSQNPDDTDGIVVLAQSVDEQDKITLSLNRNALVEWFKSNRACDVESTVDAHCYVFNEQGDVIADSPVTIEYSPTLFVIDYEDYPLAREVLLQAASARDEAFSAKESAISAKESAISAKSDAEKAKTRAEEAVHAAVEASGDAGEAAEISTAASKDAITAKNAAQDAQRAAEESASTAETALEKMIASARKVVGGVEVLLWNGQGEKPVPIFIPNGIDGVTGYVKCDEDDKYYCLKCKEVDGEKVLVLEQVGVDDVSIEGYVRAVNGSTPDKTGNVVIPLEFLPLTGGTINGAVKYKTPSVVSRTTNDTYIALCGGKGYKEGGRIIAYGKDNKGVVYLEAHDGTNRNVLTVYANGRLTLNDDDIVKDIVRSVNGVNADNAGNVVIPLNFLPLTGGTMSSGIYSSADEFFIQGINGTKTIRISGGRGWDEGGSFLVRGKKHPNFPGQFACRACDGVNERLLVGTPSGMLTWDGSQAFLPAGAVFAFAANTTPSGCLICNGAEVSRTTYARLFAAIGTTYGSGDGSTTFNLPNLTDRFIQGSGTAGTYKAAGLPNHTHTYSALGYTGSYGKYERAVWSCGDSGGVGPTTAEFSKASESNAIYGASTTVQPPALTMRYYIKY